MNEPPTYDPQRVTAETTRAALFQDVVRATSRVLHSEPVETEDRRALRAAKDLLNRVASSKIALPADGAQQLSSTSETLAFLRAARPPTSEPVPVDFFKDLAAGLQNALKGDRSDETLGAIRSLRDIFLLVGRLDLDRSVLSEQEEEAAPPSTPLTASLNS